MTNEVKQRVEQILKAHISARNNDGSLIAYYIAKYHAVSQDEHDTYFNLKYMKSVPISSIRRNRRIIQNTEHKYLPTDPKVLHRRKLQEVAMRKELGYNSSING